MSHGDSGFRCRKGGSVGGGPRGGGAAVYSSEKATGVRPGAAEDVPQFTNCRNALEEAGSRGISHEVSSWSHRGTKETTEIPPKRPQANHTHTNTHGFPQTRQSNNGV